MTIKYLFKEAADCNCGSFEIGQIALFLQKSWLFRKPSLMWVNLFVSTVDLSFIRAHRKNKVNLLYFEVHLEKIIIMIDQWAFYLCYITTGVFNLHWIFVRESGDYIHDIHISPGKRHSVFSQPLAKGLSLSLQLLYFIFILERRKLSSMSERCTGYIHDLWGTQEN